MLRIVYFTEQLQLVWQSASLKRRDWIYRYARRIRCVKCMFKVIYLAIYLVIISYNDQITNDEVSTITEGRYDTRSDVLSNIIYFKETRRQYVQNGQGNTFLELMLRPMTGRGGEGWHLCQWIIIHNHP